MLLNGGLLFYEYDAENIYKYTRDYCEKIQARVTSNRTDVNIIFSGITLEPGEKVAVPIKFRVLQSNISLNVIENKAEIETIQNKNNLDVTDSTPNDNEDSDYIQTDDITISGFVWNDMFVQSDKGKVDYNGVYDKEKDELLSGITVYLVRETNTQGVVGDIVGETKTDVDGKYSFTKENLTIGNSKEKYIKASKEKDTNRWNKTYYSYYVYFMYDGLKYTPTQFSEVGSDTDNINASNAKETIDDRISFNRQFSTIDGNSSLTYETINKEGKIPQSQYKYDENEMQIMSYTNVIELSNSTNLATLQHVNLGLRGKDIFDLELTSDVDNIKVTINGEQGVYKYSNKVKLRQEDLKINSQVTEDMANTKEEASNLYVDTQTQEIRDIDFNIDNRIYDESQGVQAIEVTYKITIHNTSSTVGMATKIKNYYDNRYQFKRAVDSNNIHLRSSSQTSGNGYGSTEITIPRTEEMLNQSDKMEIFVVYTLKDINTTLSGLTTDNPIPTYNMSEIVEYTTKSYIGTDDVNKEFTRGLIDKDSAPNSVNKEQVRLVSTEGQSTSTKNGNPTTVQYYFNKKLEKNKDNQEYLLKLKYEDDTYATPTIYFVIKDDVRYTRTIKGTVFRDDTITDAATKIKTGNGKLDEGEKGIYGATVQLIELKDITEKKEEYSEKGIQMIELNRRYYPIRDTVTTVADNPETEEDELGTFEFKNFLPGNYIIRYYYGHNNETVLKNMYEENINEYSFNGENYQSTNNSYAWTVADKSGILSSNILEYENLTDAQKPYWYAYNEEQGISTAIDAEDRRNTVINNVTNINDDNSDKIMILLNKAREGTLTVEELNTGLPNGSLIEQTYMYADTKPMLLTVEKMELKDRHVEEGVIFAEYVIDNMNFGIAEVPVTVLNLNKQVEAFTIIDAIEKNKMISLKREGNGVWKIIGDIQIQPRKIYINIEDKKLQGATLKVTYAITTDVIVEKNFDGLGTTYTEPIIQGLVDFIDNELSYSPEFEYTDSKENKTFKNEDYWDLISYDNLQKEFNPGYTKGETEPMGTVDKNGTKYNTIVKAKAGTNPLVNGGNKAVITLEKVLYSPDSILENIIANMDESYEYDNIVEITKLNYEELRSDLIRTNAVDRYIVIPGIQHDAASSETISILPPTGDTSINTSYYILAMISLTIITLGAIGIKKFVLNK